MAISSKKSMKSASWQNNMWKVIKREFKLRNFCFGYEHPYHFYTSTIETPRHFYLCWTLFWFLFHCGGVSAIFGLSTTTHLERLLAFATIWGYLCLTFITLLDLIFVILFQYVWPSSRQEKHQDVMPWYFKFSWCISSLVYNSSLMITIAYWVLLYKDDGVGNQGVNIVEHAINSVYTFLNIWITNKPIRILHFWPLIAWFVVYIIFLGIYYSAGGVSKTGQRYIYPFLNFERPEKMAIYVTGLIIAIPIINLVMFSLYRTRLWLIGKLKRQSPSVDDLTSPKGSLEIIT